MPACSRSKPAGPSRSSLIGRSSSPIEVRQSSEERKRPALPEERHWGKTPPWPGASSGLQADRVAIQLCPSAVKEALQLRVDAEEPAADEGSSDGFDYAGTSRAGRLGPRWPAKTETAKPSAGSIASGVSLPAAPGRPEGCRRTTYPY